MKKQLLNLSLMLALGAVTASAYTIPSGYEIKNVIIGTAVKTGDVITSVTPEDFTNATEVPTGWAVVDATSFSIANVTYVENVEIGAAVTTAPTYVNGNCLQVYAKNKGWAPFYGGYSFDAVSTGKLCFEGDLSGVGNYPAYFRLVDKDGNNVFTFHPNNGSNGQNFSYQIGSNAVVKTSEQTNPRSYKGYGIKDLELDFTTGNLTFVLDYCAYSSSGTKRAQKTYSLNIGTEKNVAGLQLGCYCGSNNNVEAYGQMDNIKLYTLGTASTYKNYTVVAKAGDTELKTLASGLAQENEEISVSGLPKVIKTSDSYYILDDANVINFSASFTMGNQDDEFEVSYTLNNSIKAYMEAENSTGYDKSGTSNDKAGYIKASTKYSLGTLPAGEYRFYYRNIDNYKRYLVLRKNGTTDNTVAYVFENTSGTDENYVDFKLLEPTDLILTGSYWGEKYQQSIDFDYAYVEKTGDLAYLYASIQKDGTKEESAGTASYEVGDEPVLSFDSEGNAVLTIGENTVAKLPIKNDAEMVFDFSSTATNAITSTVSAAGYSTLYSPFQLQMPENSEVEVFAPTYKEGSINLNDETKIAAGAVIPAGTGLILKNQGSITLPFSTAASTVNTENAALSGTAIKMNTPTDEGTILILAKPASGVGFYKYTGTYLSAGKAYLALPASEAKSFVGFSFDDATAISNVDADTSTDSAQAQAKFIKNNKLVIVKNGKQYNAAGQILK